MSVRPALSVQIEHRPIAVRLVQENGPAINVQATRAIEITVSPVGLQGPPGGNGDQGPPGPEGSFRMANATDPPDGALARYDRSSDSFFATDTVDGGFF